ncbi:MAG: CoB--CoM heterodisulfide reductase iron-sulfur subunit A family protein [Candidatus Heimdallarchaeum aukensis]|uniref:CoB--CoM heterodisulfide reductase iron-sulfur subunit A n=1 Tax=Candidatus Heimdallarchaeum aukensis TaxID=2876573 RepID=A0A9Y1BMJ4_9ARCH|nr:MAG: CoB--CoM heterodisulfide reductase iron-sulfur subunit A family protein [Candidatus Heimdallarchaeum aukensis]
MKNYDALVIGAGISGIQTALDLAEQGFKVLMIDKKKSTGGVMIQLSKVFPTLDCASCITTPKMSEASNHPNIETWTLSEVTSISENNGSYVVNILKHPRYVDLVKCTGCGICEEVCPVIVEDEYNEYYGIRKAVGVPFGTAIPQKAVLEPEYCIFCGACAKKCPTQAIEYDQEPENIEVKVKAVIVATGFEQTPIKEEYGGGRYKNVINALTMERLLAPTSPFGGVFRPGDGKNPYSIAYIQCAGSRDASIGVPYCSRVCCMFAVKQAMLLCGAAPLADITIYYMDIRAFGKRYEEFFQEAREMGINFVKGKVAKIEELENGNLKLRVEVQEEEDYGVKEIEHELVVLSSGMLPAWKPEKVREILPLEIHKYGFIKSLQPHVNPSQTNLDGIFVSGTAMAPMDIVDSIYSGSTAAMKAALYIKKIKE